MLDVIVDRPDGPARTEAFEVHGNVACALSMVRNPIAAALETRIRRDPPQMRNRRLIHPLAATHRARVVNVAT
jgi:hypothetical protein